MVYRLRVNVMSEGKKKYPDPLVRQRLFSDAAEIFSFAPANLAQALEHGIVVVDTNVLLVPYTTGRASLEQIRRTYEILVTEKRLRIPGQVAREFADNRAEKLKTLYQQLSRKRDINLARSEYPLLEGLAE
jgi:PIN like domain